MLNSSNRREKRKGDPAVALDGAEVRALCTASPFLRCSKRAIHAGPSAAMRPSTIIHVGQIIYFPLQFMI